MVVAINTNYQNDGGFSSTFAVYSKFSFSRLYFSSPRLQVIEFIKQDFIKHHLVRVRFSVKVIFSGSLFNRFGCLFFSKNQAHFHIFVRSLKYDYFHIFQFIPSIVTIFCLDLTFAFYLILFLFTTPVLYHIINTAQVFTTNNTVFIPFNLLQPSHIFSVDPGLCVIS